MQFTIKKYFSGLGGQYAGNSIRLITEKATLDDLEIMLGDKFGKPVCDFLRAVRKVHEISMADEVSSDYPKHFEEFRKTFLVLHRLIKLPWTLKV